MSETDRLRLEDAFSPEVWTDETIDYAVHTIQTCTLTRDELERVYRMIIKVIHHVEVKKDRKRVQKEIETARKEAEITRKEIETTKEKAEIAREKIQKIELQITNSIIKMLKMNTTPHAITQMIDGISLEEVLKIKEKLNDRI